MSKVKSPDPLAVIVAEAVIEDGQVHMTDRLPESIELLAGQDLHLDLVYRFDESDGSREQFAVRLRSRLGEERAPEAERYLRDTPMLQDEEWGRIRQVYRAPPPGKHELVVDFEADYGTRPWRSDGDGTLQRSETSHSISVIVHDD